jgi:putative endonuclease
MHHTTGKFNPMVNPYCVYILTNKNHTVLYVGFTNSLGTRVWEHKTKQNPKSFTAKYNVYKLVYFENFADVNEGIAREKAIKNRPRKYKLELISKMNPSWDELDGSSV